MNTYVAVVFANDDKARSGLRALWGLDEEAEITVHGAAVVRRDDSGHIHVADRHSDLGMRTAMGVGLGALLGLIAGPAGVAAGMSVAAATGVGAAVGGVVGLTADAVTEEHRENAAVESFFTLKHGQSAVVAEISEEWTSPLDDAMHGLGGIVYRRANTAATNASFEPSYYNSYLYPYFYDPFYG